MYPFPPKKFASLLYYSHDIYSTYTDIYTDILILYSSFCHFNLNLQPF